MPRSEGDGTFGCDREVQLILCCTIIDGEERDGTNRPVIDFRRLNKITVFSLYR